MKCDTMTCSKEATVKQSVSLSEPRSARAPFTYVTVCEEHRPAMHNTPGLIVLKEVEVPR